MSYCSKADLIDRVGEKILIQLTQETAGQIAPNDDVINQAIVDADEEIESYAAKRYSVPFSPVPGRIKTLSVDIAVYNLYSRKSRTFDNEIISERHKSAISFLSKLAKGEVTLGEIPEPAESPVASRSSFSGNTRIFDRESMKDF